MKRIAIAFFIVAAAAAPALAQRTDSQPLPTLAVSGDARILAAPDEATVRLGIVRQAPTAQAAQEQTNAIAQEILKGITALGVPPPQVQTSRLVLSPVYAPRSPESRDAPRIVAYNASNVVAVRLENLALVGRVIDAGLKAGANQLDGVQFGLRNELPSREQALRQAVAEARSKAQVMADASRVGLIEVLEISEGNVSIVPSFAEQVQFRAAVAQDTPVSPGQIEVRASVTIRYRIGQKPQ